MTHCPASDGPLLLSYAFPARARCPRRQRPVEVSSTLARLRDRPLAPQPPKLPEFFAHRMRGCYGRADDSCSKHRGSAPSEAREHRVWVRFPPSQENGCQPVVMCTVEDSDTHWFGKIRDVFLGGLALVMSRRFDVGALLIIDLEDEEESDPSSCRWLMPRRKGTGTGSWGANSFAHFGKKICKFSSRNSFQHRSPILLPPNPKSAI